MSNPTQSQIALLYFQCFCKKDTASLEVLFSDNIILADWEVEVVGKQNVLDFNQRFFNSVNEIRIDVDKVAIGLDTVIAELKVIINNKIEEIRAYKR